MSEEKKQNKKFAKKGAGKKGVSRKGRHTATKVGLSKPGFSPLPVTKNYTTISDIVAALRPKPITMPRNLGLLSVNQDSDDEAVVVRTEEKKVAVKEELMPKSSVRALLGLGRRNRSDMHMTFQLFAGTPVTTASSAGSYFPLFTAFTSGNVLWATLIASVQEFNSLDVLFDEFHISQVRAEFQPNDRYTDELGTTALNNSGATVSFLPDNSGLYTNTSTAWISMRSAIESKGVRIGDPFKFLMRNPTKLDWNGPIGDQTTAQSNMGWCSFANTSTYGGAMQMAFPYATSASPTSTQYAESIPIGSMIWALTVHVRARA